MDSTEMMKIGINQLMNMKSQDQNLVELQKPSESSENRKERIDSLKRVIPNIMNRCGFPPKFIRMDLKGIISLDELKNGLCLVGKSGVGKTMAVSLLMRDELIYRSENSPDGARWDYIKEEKRWKFVNYPAFIMKLQDSYKHGKGEETALEMLDNLLSIKYLIIDDLGAEKLTDYVKQATYYLINEREINEMPIFLTSNFSMDFLDDNLDQRISSRIAGMCKIIHLEGEDRRVVR